MKLIKTFLTLFVVHKVTLDLNFIYQRSGGGGYLDSNLEYFVLRN